MVSPRVHLKSAFAVPIAEARLSPCGDLNHQLETLFLARESDEYRNPTPAHVPQEEMFESRFNLFLWPEAGIQELRVFMLNCVGQTVMEADDLARAEPINLVHVTRYAGSFVAHNHPLASWSAVYCVRAGERFRPARQRNAQAHGYPRRRGRYSTSPTGTQAAFAWDRGRFVSRRARSSSFPPLFHEVTPFYGRDTRLTVASNCWFTSSPP